MLNTSIHPWRVCPYGEHQVISHPRHNPPSKTHPEGSTSNVRWHCARNPTGKDQLYADEIREIAAQHFSGLKNKPCPLSLGFPNGSKYDDLISGWVQYWNEVLKPDQPLDPNLVKALIASESNFYPEKLNNKKDSNSARGLMQITNETRKLLDAETELKDHFVTATQEDLNDPGVNICAGVRWLFRKREIASTVRLKRPATWLEAAEEYKGDLKGLLNGSNKSQTDVAPFLKYLKEIEKCLK
ncbi:MAG: transglycosylase SLT domain-containing protein [Methylotenera sp.]|nr:transglycosylase SLT domain-containing protein [Oligoflexia bacterium]